MAYSQARTITIDHTKCGATDSANFPMLVDITDVGLKTVANSGHVQNGSDIAFFGDSGLTTALKFEIESYNASTGQFRAWVKIPNLSASVDTVIYLAYGDAAVTTDQSDTTNTWSNGYALVVHGGDGTTLDLTNKVSGGITLTNHSATAGVGAVRGGISFASSQFVDSATAALTALPATIECWFKVASLATATLVCIANSGAVTSMAELQLRSSGAIRGVSNNSGSVHNQDTVAVATAGVYQHAAGVFATGNQASYVNGGNKTVQTGTLVPIAGPYTTAIGCRQQNGSNTQFVTGQMDEIRISSVARSDDWILAQFNSINSPGTFFTLGSEGAPSSGWSSGDVFGSGGYDDLIGGFD